MAISAIASGTFMTSGLPHTGIPRIAPPPRHYSAPYMPVAPNQGQATHALAAGIGAVIVFFLFSHASEFIDTTGRLHIVLLLGVTGLLAVMAVGTLPQYLVTTPGVWLSLFTVWLIMSIPFSSWRGESFRNVTGIWLKSYIAFFLVAGLIFTVEQFRKTLFWLALSTVAVMYYAFRAGFNSEDNRFSASYGSLGNSNDLASTLLMGLPFILYVAVDKRRNALLRIIACVATCLLLLVVVRTGSRGAIVAIAAMVAYAFFKTSAANKFKILVIAGVLVVSFPLVVSKDLMARYGTILHSNKEGLSADAASAVDSSHARRELMKQAVRLTVRHPVFGVGIGNFISQSANLFIARGEAPLWFTCHDLYLLVSSETGVPGFIMYMAVIVVSYRTLLRLQKKARSVPELHEIADMAFCVILSFTAFLCCGIFSTAAYSVSLPMIAGLAVVLEHVSKPAMDRAAAALQPQIASAHFFPRALPRVGQTSATAYRS